MFNPNDLRFEAFDRTKGVKLPVRSTEKAAAYDIFAPEDIRIVSIRYSDAPTKIHTGIKVVIPSGEIIEGTKLELDGELWCKSSLGAKGLVLHGCLFDNDYLGELIVVASALYHDINIKKGEKCAQIKFTPVLLLDDGGGERVGGFGSTGK